MFRRFYGRKSRSMGDPNDLDVFAHQINPLIRMAELDGPPVRREEIIVEVGSGELIAKRPHFSKILAEMNALPARDGGELWAADVDRLSRGGMTERGLIQDACRRAAVLMRTPSRTLDMDDADDRLWFEFTSGRGANEYERNKARVAARREEMALQNLVVTGKAPFGYVWDKNGNGTLVAGKRRGCLRPDPERFPILQSLCRDAPRLSVEALGEKYGLHPSTVCWNLRNPIICGYAARRFGLHRGTKPWLKQASAVMPREKWIWPERPGEWIAACTREEWDRIQQVMDRRYTLKGRTDFTGNGWCRDAVTFAGFPGRCRLNSIAGHGLPPRHIYEKVVTGRPRLYVQRQPVHDFVEDQFLALFDRPDLVMSAFTAYERSRKERQEAAPDEQARLNRKLESLRRQLDDLLRREINADGEEAASIGRVRAAVKSDIGRLTAQLQEPGSLTEQVPALDAIAADLPDLVVDLAPGWEEMNGADRRRALNAFVLQVPVEIEFRAPGERGHRRRFLPLVYQPWLARYL